MRTYHNPLRRVRLREMLDLPAEKLSRADANALALGFQKSLDDVHPARMRYDTRTRRAGKKNPAYTHGAGTRERRNVERRFGEVARRLLTRLREHEWRTDAFHPTVRLRAVHLRRIFEVGVRKDGLVVSRTWQPTPLERLKGAWMCPKAALPLMRKLVVVAEQLLSWLENLATTGGWTVAGTTRTAFSEATPRNFAVQRGQTEDQRRVNEDQRHQERKRQQLADFAEHCKQLGDPLPAR